MITASDQNPADSEQRDAAAPPVPPPVHIVRISRTGAVVIFSLGDIPNLYRSVSQREIERNERTQDEQESQAQRETDRLRYASAPPVPPPVRTFSFSDNAQYRRPQESEGDRASPRFRWDGIDPNEFSVNGRIRLNERVRHLPYSESTSNLLQSRSTSQRERNEIMPEVREWNRASGIRRRIVIVRRLEPAARSSNPVAMSREERERTISQLREENKNPAPAMSRSCRICFADSPTRRAVFTSCGHCSCHACALYLQGKASEEGRRLVCPFCRAETGFVPLFEDPLGHSEKN